MITSRYCFKKNTIDNGGYTLVETLVYAAILVIIIGAIVGVLVLNNQQFMQFRVNEKIIESANLSLGRLTRDIRESVNVSTTTSIFNTNPGALELVVYDSVLATTTVNRFYKEDGALMVQVDDGTPGRLTARLVRVTNLIFRYQKTGTTTEAVRVEMDIEGGTSTAITTKHFYMSGVPRGGY